VPKTVEFPLGQIAERLGKVTILSSLKDKELKNLAKWVKVTAFSDGETVVRRGDGGIGLFLILEGAAEVRRGNRKLARLGVGQFFGEMTLFDDLPRSADVVTLQPSTFAVLSKWEFWSFALASPEVLRGVLKEMGRRLRETDQALSE
jgi:CRP/FNR family transcriptional regulator, cyclic AMP receptor protein